MHEYYYVLRNLDGTNKKLVGTIKADNEYCAIREICSRFVGQINATTDQKIPRIGRDCFAISLMVRDTT